MFNKAKRNFIIYTMIIFLALLLLVFGLFCFFYKSSINVSIYKELENIKKNYLLNHFPTNNDYFIAKLTNYDETTATFNYVLLDGNESFNDTKINSIIKYAIEKKFIYGHFDKKTYYTFSIKDSTIICADISNILIIYKETLINFAISLAFIYLVLSGLTFLVASKIFQPIKESFYRQQKFLSDASHELKTPIAILSANADVLKAQQQEKNEYLENIKSQTERMKFLVTDMLVLSRIEEEKPTLNKEHFSVSDETIKIILPFDAVAFENKKTIEFDVQKDVNYIGDLESFKKILTILLDNAVKYAKINSTVKVTLKKDANRINLIVYNEGSEVFDQDSNKVFERFFRANDSRSRNTGGSGLGLTIAKSIADLNKWKLTAKSKYQESMTLTLTI